MQSLTGAPQKSILQTWKSEWIIATRQNLLDHQSIITQDLAHVHGSTNESQMMDENSEVGAEAKRQEDMSPRISCIRSTNLMSLLTKSIQRK